VSRHRFDLPSAVVAVLFLGVATRYLERGFGAKTGAYHWVVPGVVAGLIVVGVLRVVFRSRRREP
jgi:hypothetical protein